MSRSPRWRRRAPLIIASDTFTRVDSATDLGSTEVGSKLWVVHEGTAGISSNQAYFPVRAASSYGAAVVDGGSADGSVTIVVNTVDGGTGPIVRASDATNRFQFEDGTLYRLQGGFTSLGSFAYTKQVGDIQKLECRGNTLNFYLNGVLKIGPVTDAFNNTVTTHGFHVGSSSALVDNFVLTN